MKYEFEYLLNMVNKKISNCLDLIEAVKKDIKLSCNYSWCNEIIKNEKLEIKELKKIKRFLIFQLRKLKKEV